MTLEELKFRVLVAFPGTVIESVDETYFRARFSEPVDVGTAHQIYGFGASAYGSGEGFVVDATFPTTKYTYGREVVAAILEVERRILSVTAHQLIAARRRQSNFEPPTRGPSPSCQQQPRAGEQ